VRMLGSSQAASLLLSREVPAIDMAEDIRGLSCCGSNVRVDPTDCAASDCVRLIAAGRPQ